MKVSAKLIKQAELYKVLGHAVRLAAIEAIKGGEKTVSEIQKLTGVTSQSAMSQHLTYMLRVGILNRKTDGVHRLYSVTRIGGQISALMGGVR